MVNSQFALALHILIQIGDGPATSGQIGASAGTNPVVVRRITARLAAAGLVRTRRGPGGTELARPADTISLGEVWRAATPPGAPLIRLHRPNTADPVGS